MPTTQSHACCVLGYIVIESLWLENQGRTTDIAPFIRLDELVDPETARRIETDPVLGDVLRLVDHWATMLEHDEDDEAVARFFRMPADRVRTSLFELAQTTAAGNPRYPPEWQALRGHL